jgi:CCR4-NOT transcription complex subunit 6
MIPHKNNAIVNRRFYFFRIIKIPLNYLGYELEVMGNVRNLSPTLWTLSQLTVLYLNDNQLTRLPSEIACLNHLVTLDISNNKLRNLPSEIGDLITLRELNLTNNSIRNLPYEIGKLFRLQSLGNSHFYLHQSILFLL